MSHHSPGYSMSIRMRYPDVPGLLSRITSKIGEEDGLIGAVDVVDSHDNRITRDITFNAVDESHGERVIAAIYLMPDLEIVNVSDRVFLMHLGGKPEVNSRVPIKTRDDLNPLKQWLAEHTNDESVMSNLSDVLPGANVFIGIRQRMSYQFRTSAV